MESKKIGFFSRIKRAITNFDAYQEFSLEKLSVAVKYFIKLMLIFALVITIALILKIYWVTKDISQKFEASFPDFKFENNELVLANNTPVEIGDDNHDFGIIVGADDSIRPDNIDMSTIDYKTVAIVLKDKVVIKNKDLDSYGLDTTITYNSVANYYNINNVTKEGIVNYINGKNMSRIYIAFFIVAFMYEFVIYFGSTLLDVLVLAILGFLISRIFKINFKFKPIFIMSFYALTLSIVLYMAYLTANILAGFEITYFRIGYNAISYIYLITAILTIKSDLIKQQIELMKIIEVQKKVKEEFEEKRKKEDKEEEKNKDKEDENVGGDVSDSSQKKEKKEEPKKSPEPEGGQAIKENQ